MEEKLSEKSKILERLGEKRVGALVPKNTPRVSVIIPAYNISAFIGATLDSVFSQTCGDFEVVLVNDGSPDTPELERALAGHFERITYARQANSGVSEARNLAIALSRGELLAFLDGDDLWLPECLEKQTAFLDAHGLDMVYCDAELFGDNYFSGRTYMETTPSEGEVTPVSLIRATCNVITSGTMVRREKLFETGMFDTRSKRAQDFDLWFRFARSGARIGYQRECLIRYRVSSVSLSGSNVSRAERNIWILTFIGDKYPLDAEERKALADQLAFSRAELELEKGKTCLAEERFEDARRHFAEANLYYRKLKLSVLKMLLKISPRLTLKIFRALRPAEFSFIASDRG